MPLATMLQRRAAAEAAGSTAAQHITELLALIAGGSECTMVNAQTFLQALCSASKRTGMLPWKNFADADTLNLHHAYIPLNTGMNEHWNE